MLAGRGGMEGIETHPVFSPDPFFPLFFFFFFFFLVSLPSHARAACCRQSTPSCRLPEEKAGAKACTSAARADPWRLIAWFACLWGPSLHMKSGAFPSFLTLTVAVVETGLPWCVLWECWMRAMAQSWEGT